MSERTNKPVSREHPLWSGCFSFVYNIAHLQKSFNELLKNEVATIPMSFEVEPVIEDVHTKISLPEDLVQKFCKKFGCKKGNLTTAIKSEIKKCIRKNLSLDLDRYFSSAKVKAIFGQVTNRVAEKKNSLDTGSERSRLIEKEWLNAFYEMKNTVNEERNKNNE